jgi:hypothetical protein
MGTYLCYLKQYFEIKFANIKLNLKNLEKIFLGISIKKCLKLHRLQSIQRTLRQKRKIKIFLPNLAQEFRFLISH